MSFEQDSHTDTASHLTSVVVELVACQIKIVVPAYAIAARVDVHLLKQSLYVRQGLKGLPLGEQRLGVVDLAKSIKGSFVLYFFEPDNTECSII